MKTAIGSAQLSTLVLRPEHPETVQMIVNPTIAHAKLTRCGAPHGSNGKEHTLFFIAGARKDGKTVIVVQTPNVVDWSPLVKERILAESSLKTLDLSKFEEGCQVRVDVLAAASRNHRNEPWEERVVTEEPSFSKNCKRLDLDPKKVKRLYRKGLTWEWTLEDGSVGSLEEIAKWEEQLADDDECRAWFMGNAFAIRDERTDRPTDEKAVEFMSCLVGVKRVMRIDHHKNDTVTRRRLLVRHYSALVTVTNQDVFADRLANGIGRYKFAGLGLVRAELV